MWNTASKYTRIKLCWFESLDAAFEAGKMQVDTLGFHIFEEQDVEERVARFGRYFDFLPSHVNKTLLTDLPEDVLIDVVCSIKFDVIQLYPDWAPAKVHSLRSKIGTNIKIIKVMSAQLSENTPPDPSSFLERYRECVDGILLDSYRDGGTGIPADFVHCARIVALTDLPVFLAGGLSCSNVEEAIRVVRPFGVDVESAVSERLSDDLCLKSMSRCRDFVEKVIEVDRKLLREAAGCI